MHKLIAMYKKPADEKAFFEHYENVHMPIVQNIPGLAKTVVNRVTGSPMGGEPEYFLIAEMHYPDAETFKAAMASDANRQAGADLKNFAQAGVTLVTAEEE